MPKKITKLTPEQIAAFEEWSNTWIKIGLSTEPADFDAAETAALAAYKLCNLNRPMLVLRMSSPYGATIGGVLALSLLQKIKQVRSQVRSQVESQVWSQVRSQVESQVWSQVESQVRSQVWSQVESQVRSQVWSQVESQVRSQVWSQDAIYNFRGGAFWASWGAYVSFLRDACGWENESLTRFEIDEALIKNCGEIWWHENVLVLSDRPIALSRDAQGRLHSETGPSIAYRDGWAMHHWHGTFVPAHWIEQRNILDPAEVLKAPNVEQRAAGAAIVGWPKMISRLQRKIIDGDPETDMGALIELTLPGLSEPGRFLQAKCPRNGTIVEGVPRISDIDNRPINTVIAAQAWRVGDPQSEYEHPPIRT